MDKNKKTQKNVGFISHYMHSKLKERTLNSIEKIEKKLKRKLTSEERRAIRDAEQKKLFREFKKTQNRIKVGAVTAAFSVASFFAGASWGKSQAQLPEGSPQNENTASLDADEDKKPSLIDSFRESLKFDTQDLDSADSKLEEAQEIVNSLTTPDKVLNYLKEVYVNEYNKSHDEAISIENVTLNRQILDVSLYEDVAQNGDTILRYSHRNDSNNFSGNSLITITISKDGEKLQSEHVTYRDGKFANVYYSDEQVESDKENSFSNSPEVGTVISSGLTYYRALNEYSQNKTSFEYANGCKQHFEEYISDMLQAQSLEENSNTQINNSGLEPGE